MSDSQQRYRVLESLESGGMAQVFRAESEGLQGFKKQVAIKRVLPHLSSKKKFISMFLDEARVSAHLSHSNCVQVFDIGVGDNAYFIVMEFVDGGNLKAVIEHLKKHNKEFPVEAAAHLSLEICKGLSYAHELTDPNGVPLNIVHRDISPPNILITKFGEVKIVDFGLAKANSQLEKSEPGIIKGKFSYLSPEAAMGQEVDARTDIFAVGIMLWELLAGQRLFLGDSDFQTVKRVQAAVIPPISAINKAVPPDLERIINRSLARDSAARYQTARDLGLDLSKFMFRHGVAVSSFDIARLVRGTMSERQRVRPQQHSIIDKLIEEALLEFTSLTEGQEKTSSHSPGARPISFAPDQAPNSRSGGPNSTGGYMDVGSWLDEISQKNVGTLGSVLKPSSLPPGVSEGNLAALEDDAPSHQSPAPRTSHLPADPLPAAAKSEAPAKAATLAPAISVKNKSVVPDSDEKGGKALAVGLSIAALILAGATAAAWFTHVIPHP